MSEAELAGRLPRAEARRRRVLPAPPPPGPRSVLLNHLIHHRGQLSVYLRLLDVPLPSIYGPTADESI